MLNSHRHVPNLISIIDFKSILDLKERKLIYRRKNAYGLAVQSNCISDTNIFFFDFYLMRGLAKYYKIKQRLGFFSFMYYVS